MQISDGGGLQRWAGLELLILEYNFIKTWSDIAFLAPLTSLVRLSLCGNPLSGAPRARACQSPLFNSPLSCHACSLM
jgi:hypothetical protein